MQLIYNINPVKCKFIRNLNRLIRNTAYNTKFDEQDDFVIYNDVIEKNNKKLKNFIENHILSINEEDEKVRQNLKQVFTEEFVIYPKFLFYCDSNLICASIEGGLEQMVDFEEIIL